MNITYKMEGVGFNDITPMTLAFDIREPEFRQTPTVHNYYMMYFIVDGTVLFENSVSQFSVRKRHCFISFPGEHIAINVTSDKAAKIITVAFFGIRALDFVSRMKLTPKNAMLEYPDTDGLMSYFKSGMNVERGGDFLAVSFIYKVFAHMYSKTEANTQNMYITKSLEYIDRNISTPLRISDIANMLGISRVYFYKTFEKAMGMSPKEYIINRKMRLAFDAIQKHRASVSSAAAMVGYTDQFAFSKLFKSKYNLSPRDVHSGKVPFVSVLNDEEGEVVWPACITTERAKRGTHSIMAHPYYNVENDIIEGWLIRAGYIASPQLPQPLDISLLTDNGKSGALSFWIFVENQCDITDWCIDEKDWIRFGSSTDWDTDFQYWLGWHKQITKEGWNKIILPFGDSAFGHVIGNPDYKAFNSFAIRLSVPYHLRVFIDDIKVVAVR